MLISLSIKNVFPFEQEINLWSIPEQENGCVFDYDSTYDNQTQKAYMQGLYGGVPD